MKKLLLILTQNTTMKRLLLILLCLPLLFGCNYIESNKSTDKLEYKSITVIDSTSKLKDLKIDSIKETQIERDNPEVIKFVKQFYSSLELSAEENQKDYVEGGVVFDLSEFISLMHENANYSEDRVNNLSGNYHSYYYIEYIGIRSIILKSDCIEVLVNVLYGLYETGGFYNIELLKIINVNGSLKMMEWGDIGLYKMEKSGYEGMEIYNETDFYHQIGSNFYLNKAEEDTLLMSWYNDDKISSESKYKSQELDGLCRKWRENGNIWYEFNYTNGLKNGEYRWWNNDGSYTTGILDNGKRTGWIRSWNIDGELIREYDATGWDE